MKFNLSRQLAQSHDQTHTRLPTRAISTHYAVCVATDSLFPQHSAVQLFTPLCTVGFDHPPDPSIERQSLSTLSIVIHSLNRRLAIHPFILSTAPLLYDGGISTTRVALHPAAAGAMT